MSKIVFVAKSGNEEYTLPQLVEAHKALLRIADIIRPWCLGNTDNESSLIEYVGDILAELGYNVYEPEPEMDDGDGWG